MDCNLLPMKGLWGEHDEGKKLDNRHTAGRMHGGRWYVVLYTEQ